MEATARACRALLSAQFAQQHTPSRHRTARVYAPLRPQRQRSVRCAADAATASASQPPEAGTSSIDEAISVQQLEAAAHDTTAFVALLEHLVQRGSSAGCTEAHVVAGWAIQQQSAALQLLPDSPLNLEGLRALVALEELTRRQVVALTADQLGFVFRCYVLSGGASRPLLEALQEAAGSWQPEDFSAAGFADLAWALASCGLPPSPSCRLLLDSVLECEQGSSTALELQQSQAEQPAVQNQQHEQPPPGAQQQPLAQQNRDWDAWFDGIPAGRLVLLLWAAGRLRCRVCHACMKAAAAALLKREAGLSALPTKSLVTLLWALATLRWEEEQALVKAVVQLLGDRLEPSLGAAQPGQPEWCHAASAPAPADSADGGSHAGLAQASGAHGSEDEEEERALLQDAAAGSPVIDSSSSSSSSLSGRTGVGDAEGLQAAALDVGPAADGAFTGLEPLHTGVLTTAVWACGQLRHGDPRVLRPAALLLQERVGQMSAGDVSRVLCGLAQLGHCPTGLLSAIAAHLQQPGVLDRFNVRQLAVTTYAFVALDFFPGQCCVDMVADACLAVRCDFAGEPRALANVLWNMSRLGYVDELFYLAFVPVILPSIERYGPSELADVARVYSRNGLNPRDERGTAEEHASLFDALARQTVARIGSADLQDVLRIMTAFHQMGLQPDELLGAVEAWANQRLQKLSPQALSMAVWSFARMGNRSPKLLETAAACAEQQLTAFSPSQLAKVAWALAKLRWRAPRVLHHAGTQLAERTAAFTDKEASNVLWALASEGERLPGAALDTIAANLEPRLKSFGPQSLANIAWAYTTLGHAPPCAFMHRLGSAALPRLPLFEPQGLSLLVWSMASLGCRHEALFREIVHLCHQRPTLLRQFEGQHLANLLWGLCRAGYTPEPAFLQDIAQEAELRVCDLKPQELFNIVWSFAQLRHHPARLFDAAARDVVPRAFSFSPQELAGTLWALAKMGHATDATLALLEAVERELVSRAPSFEPRHLAITAWSAGQIGYVMSDAARGALLAAVKPSQLEPRTLVTLLDGFAAMERQRARQARPPPDLPSPAAAGSGSELPMAQSPLIAPEVLDAMVERAAQLLPRTQPFEFAQLVHGFAVLGSAAARQAFLCAPDEAATQALTAAAKRAPLPAVVGLLWAAASCGCCEGPGFDAIAKRLRHTRPQYRLTQPALAMLGQALQLMPGGKAQAIGLRSGLHCAALAAAKAAAQSAAAAAAGDDAVQSSRSSSGAGESGDDPDSWNASRWISSSMDEGQQPHNNQQRQRPARPAGGAAVEAAMSAPDVSDGEAVPLEGTFESEEEFGRL